MPGKKTKQAGGNQFEQMMNMFNMAQQQQDTRRSNGRYSNESPNNFGTAGKGLLDNREVTIEIEEPKKTMRYEQWPKQMGIDLNETLGALSPKKKSNVL